MVPTSVDYNRKVGMDDLRRLLQNRGASQRADARNFSSNMAPPPIDYNRNVGMDDIRRLQNRGAPQRAGGSVGAPASFSGRNGGRRSNFGPPLSGNTTRTNTLPVDKKDKEPNTNIAHSPSYMPASHSLKADSASFVSMADSAEMSPYANPASLQAYLTKKALQDEMLELSLEDDAPPNSNAHRSDLSGSSNIGENPSFASTSAPGAAATEQKPASMSDVLAYLSNIQQGIASIDKGMISIQREIASVKEQVNALPGIFAVLPEFIGWEVVSHVETELLEPLGQRVSDLEQRFTGLQTAEEKGLTKSLAWPYNTAEAGAAAIKPQRLEVEGSTEEASYTPAEAGTVFSEREISEPDDGYDDGESDLSESLSISDTEVYDFKSFPFSYDNWYLSLGRSARGPSGMDHGIDAVEWEAKYGRNEGIRQMAKSILDRECPGWAAQQQPWKAGDWM
ncbi:hypothetical protein LTR56_011137 [Elasticomyces elasticus]|nr:hypothetical protein LTR56_011137 [Elasticomyces elasticus]KAK3662442.1 hypothetical protein LTR22_006721 [Elasticomyces elasticus]KAK4926431.1 hypothetical protein LTR49_006638 [Elasticomyces elasticus]KAK5761196.1 hypothetical protein LTS12_008677 [Elasticomyces elasticus]